MIEDMVEMTARGMCCEDGKCEQPRNCKASTTEAKHAIATALGVDHYLKLVVIVDDDVDVFDDSDVLWAIATRAQADRDLVIISGSLGAILDPSATEEGVTAKLGIDATKPLGDHFSEKLVMDPEKMAWARNLVDQLESGHLLNQQF